LQPALAIALLGAIESLLSAVVADGLAGDRYDSNTELIAQGISNLICPFFGGFAGDRSDCANFGQYQQWSKITGCRNRSQLHPFSNRIGLCWMGWKCTDLCHVGSIVHGRIADGRMA
jgi:hypothetical protein